MNGGSTWSRLNLALGDPSDWTRSKTTNGSYFIRRDPQNPQVLHAVGLLEGRLARSSDFGTTWTQPEDPRPFNFADIAVHEASSNVVLALGNGFEGPALWRSEDGGATFEPQWNTGLPVYSWESEDEPFCEPF